jgi:hypothetical protein
MQFFITTVVKTQGIKQRENNFLLVTLLMTEMNYLYHLYDFPPDINNIFDDSNEVNAIMAGTYKVYNRYFDRIMTYDEFFKSYWPTIYGVYFKGINVEDYSINLFTTTLHVLERIQDGLKNADSNTLEFSVINIFIPFIFSDVVLNGFELVKIKAHTKISDAFSENLFYDWLNRRHDIYDDLITKLYILLLKRPVETINGLACVSSCLRCIRVAIMGTLS